MADNKDNYLEGWAKGIEETSKKSQKAENTLTPNVDDMRFITSYAKTINEKAIQIDWTSKMAHAGHIPFDNAQKIIDNYKKQLAKDLDAMNTYLGI